MSAIRRAAFYGQAQARWCKLAAMGYMRILCQFLVAAMLWVGSSCVAANADGTALPERDGPRPKTTDGVPHVQIGVKRAPEIKAELLRLVATIPGVLLRPTVISLPGAKGFWLDEKIALANPKSIVGGREFAHVHPDGSLHASLSPDRSRQAVAAGWAVRHPWADERDGWQGFVMIYTPTSKEQLKTVFRLVVDSYNFVTGRSYGAR